MPQVLISFAFLLMASPFLQAQSDPQYSEIQFHRVFLKNGNVIDGQMIQQTPQAVLLRIRGGEMSIRMDSVERVEFIKIKSLKDTAVVLRPVTSSAPPPKGPEAAPAVPGRTPTDIKLDSSTNEAVQALIEEYGKADVEKKQFLLNKMIGMGGQVQTYLASVISRFDRDQVPLVLTALAQTKNADLVPVMGSGIAAGDPAMRLNLVMALGMLGIPSALSQITPSLKDQDPAIRTAAVTAISILPSPDAFDALLPCVTEPDRETRTRAIGALNDMASKNGRKRDLGDALVAGLPNSGSNLQTDLLFALGRGGHTSLWSSILPYLSSDSVAVRKAAAEALTELAVPESADGVLGAAGSEKDSKVRAALARTFQKLGRIQAGGLLISWLADPDVATKNAVRTALAALAGQDLGADLAKWETWWEKAKAQ